MFQDYKEVKPGSWPVIGIGSSNAPLQVHGCGNIPIKTRVNGEWNEGVLFDFIFVPGLGANLFLVRSATNQGAVCNFSGKNLVITRGEKVVAVGTSQQ